MVVAVVVLELGPQVAGTNNTDCLVAMSRRVLGGDVVAEVVVALVVGGMLGLAIFSLELSLCSGDTRGGVICALI